MEAAKRKMSDLMKYYMSPMCNIKDSCGFPLRKCLRFVTFIGILSGIIYIAVGVYIIDRMGQHEQQTLQILKSQVNESWLRNASLLNETDSNYLNGSNIFYDTWENQTLFYYHDSRGGWVSLAVYLMTISMVQIIADIYLVRMTFKTKSHKVVSGVFMMNAVLWVLTLIAFIIIISASASQFKKKVRGSMFFILMGGTVIRFGIQGKISDFIVYLKNPDSRSSSGTSRSADAVRRY